MSKLMKKILGLTAAFMLGSNVCSAQTDAVVEELNKRNFWTPYATALQSDERMEDYMRRMGSYSSSQLSSMLGTIEEDHRRAQELLTARDEIGGKIKGSKQDKRLARRFKDVDGAKRAFETAEQMEHRYEVLKDAIIRKLAQKVPQKMPAGRLKSFDYAYSNAFAGYRDEITLTRTGGKGELLIKEQRMMFDGKEPEEPRPVIVEDSVLERVRAMVEEGRLYDVGSYYDPEIEIMDGPSWSMDFTFEGGRISSGGYAAGPDHADALHSITAYLKKLYDELKK